MHQNRHMTNISEKIKECRPSRLPRRRRCSRLHHHHHTPHAGGRQDAAYRTPPPPPPPPPTAPTTGRHHHQHTRCRNHQAHRHHLFKKHEREMRWERETLDLSVTTMDGGEGRILIQRWRRGRGDCTKEGRKGRADPLSGARSPLHGRSQQSLPGSSGGRAFPAHANQWAVDNTWIAGCGGVVVESHVVPMHKWWVVIFFFIFFPIPFLCLRFFSFSSGTMCVWESKWEGEFFDECRRWYFK